MDATAQGDGSRMRIIEIAVAPHMALRCKSLTIFWGFHGFPKSWGYPQIHFINGCSIINHEFWATPNVGNHRRERPKPWLHCAVRCTALHGTFGSFGWPPWQHLAAGSLEVIRSGWWCNFTILKNDGVRQPWGDHENMGY